MNQSRMQQSSSCEERTFAATSTGISAVKRMIAALLLISPSMAIAQAGSKTPLVVDMGVIPAKQAYQGLGFGISQPGYTQDWEFAAAKAAGASWVRIQCPWSAVGQQTPPPNNLPAAVPFQQTPGCAAALTSAAKYGLQVTEVAAFGPPTHQILYATIPNGAPVGSSSLNLQFFQGIGGSTLSSIKPLYDYWCPVTIGDDGLAGKSYECSYIPTAHNSYQGALITQVNVVDSTHATIGLASALTATLPPNPVAATGCSIAAGSGTLTCTSGNFNPNYVDKVQLVIPGAQSYGADFTTTITGFNSANQITLPCCANTTVHNVTVKMNLMYAVGEILYPSAATASPTDPSVTAYGDYVAFLAKDMADRGVIGEIELWNEPPWAGDPWDFRPLLFDKVTTGAFVATDTYKVGDVVSDGTTYYACLVGNNLGHYPSSSPTYWTTTAPANVYEGQPGFGANFGFAAHIQHRTFPDGVTAVWNGTSGSAYASLLTTNMVQYSGEALRQPSNVITRESFHPYGGNQGNPEDMMGLPSCLASAAAVPTINPYSCYLPGQSDTANLMYAVFLDDRARLQNPNGGIGHSITETNIVGEAPNQRTLQARFDVRHYLGFQAMGVTPIEFFQLWDDTHNDPSFSFVDYNGQTMTPFTALLAFTGLINDLASINASPALPYTASTLPSVQSYSGSFPIVSMNMVGSRKKAIANSDAMVVWQLSASPTDWLAMPSPAPALVVIAIPSTFQVTQVVNLTTRASVAFTQTRQTLSFSVADDPIEILLDPAVTAAEVPVMTVTATPNAGSYGGLVVVSASLAPYSTVQHSSNGEQITFSAGDTLLGTGALTSGTASINVTSLPIGNPTIVASFAGDFALTSATATTQVKIGGISSELAFKEVSDAASGTANIPLSATSTSSGSITYSVSSGPASITGNLVTLTGVGRVTIKADQAAYGAYLATSAFTSFNSLPAVATNLVFATSSLRVFTPTPFALASTSSSSAPVTYTVVSGPAIISGNLVTLTNVGLVTLAASQPAQGVASAASASATVNVIAALPSLGFKPVAANKNGSAPFAISASSPSSGSITYSILSGPATMSGSTVTLNGVGLVAVKAVQAASGPYLAGQAQMSFMSK